MKDLAKWKTIGEWIWKYEVTDEFWYEIRAVIVRYEQPIEDSMSKVYSVCILTDEENENKKMLILKSLIPNHYYASVTRCMLLAYEDLNRRLMKDART